MEARQSILIVDDQPANIKVLLEIFQQEGFRVSVAKNGKSALVKAEEAAPDLILLDVMMPGMSGYETCERLKASPTTQQIPIIFLSALDQSLNIVKAFELGGADYITKPFQAEEVLVRVRHQLELRLAKAEIIRLNDQLEQRIHERTAELMALNQSLEAEICERKNAEAQLRYGALHDALTSLPNRILFTEHLELAQAKAQRNENYQFAVLFIDLDRFKSINDTMGHQTGDQLLIMVADRLQRMLRATDILSRLGGDEFIILLDQISGIEEATKISERIVAAFQAPFTLNASFVFATASIGVALNSELAGSGIELLRNADIAMYRAKGSGKARLQVFDQQMYIQTLAKHELEKDLRQGLGRGEFKLHYQPIFDIQDETIRGFEALIRWQHPEKGWIAPAKFIPMAEELGLIVNIGNWVLRTACQQLAQWQTEIPEAASLYVSVNLSTMQLKESLFSETLDLILVETGLGKHCLQLELTESMLMGDSHVLVELFHCWVNQGIQLSIDDFGTGYSNLSYLHQFPIQSIKVDQSFVCQMIEQPEKYNIVKTIINLAHQLKMSAIAEGIECAEQLQILKELNCDKGQGYFFSPPLSSDAAQTLLKQSISSTIIDHSLLA
jgi:diguanylate cyclase (GGDEF)-like protein